MYVSLTFNDLLDRGYEVLDFKLKQSEKQHVVGDVPSLKEYETKTSWEYYSEDLLEILNTLSITYSKGINHRDIKPANIFLEHDIDTEGEVVTNWLIGDFGLSGGGAAGL